MMNSNPDDATIAALAEGLENGLSLAPTVSERLLQEKSVAGLMPGDLPYVHSDRSGGEVGRAARAAPPRRADQGRAGALVEEEGLGADGCDAADRYDKANS